MQIICKKRLQFTQYAITINPLNREQVARIERTFVVSPSTRPQQVPDWTRQDDVFDFAMGDGSLIPVGEFPAKESVSVIEEPTAQITQSTEVARELSQEDLAILSQPIGELTGIPEPGIYPRTSRGFPRPNQLS